MIRIHTQVDKTTVHHAEQMIRSTLQLALHPEDVEFTVCTMHGGCEEMIASLRSDGLNNNIEVIQAQRHSDRSVGHGLALNTMIERLNTSDTNVIVDSDVMIVMPRWDDMLEHVLIRGALTMGTPYEPVGGHSSGSGRGQTYKKLPNAIWMLLGAGIPWNELNMLPDKHRSVKLDARTGAINGLNHAKHDLFRDVGWRIPEFLFEHRVPYITFDHVKAMDERSKVLKGLSTWYHEEYQIAGMPFCVHHRGGSKHAYRQSAMSIAFYDRVWEYINDVKNIKHSWFDELKSVEPQVITVPQ